MVLVNLTTFLCALYQNKRFFKISHTVHIPSSGATETECVSISISVDIWQMTNRVTTIYFHQSILMS